MSKNGMTRLREKSKRWEEKKKELDKRLEIIEKKISKRNVELVVKEDVYEVTVRESDDEYDTIRYLTESDLDIFMKEGEIIIWSWNEEEEMGYVSSSKRKEDDDEFNGEDYNYDNGEIQAWLGYREMEWGNLTFKTIIDSGYFDFKKKEDEEYWNKITKGGIKNNV